MEALTVKICMNTPSMIRGAMDIMDQIETLNDVVNDLHLSRPIDVLAVKALQGSEFKGNCPVVQVGDTLIYNATTERVMEVILDQTEGGQYK